MIHLQSRKVGQIMFRNFTFTAPEDQARKVAPFPHLRNDPLR